MSLRAAREPAQYVQSGANADRGRGWEALPFAPRMTGLQETPRHLISCFTSSVNEQKLMVCSLQFKLNRLPSL